MAATDSSSTDSSESKAHVISSFREKDRRAALTLAHACIPRLSGGGDHPLAILTCDRFLFEWFWLSFVRDDAHAIAGDVASSAESLGTMETPSLPANFSPPAGTSCRDAVSAMSPWLGKLVPRLSETLAECDAAIAQLRADPLSRAFVAQHGLTDDEVFAVALFFCEGGARWQFETFAFQVNEALGRVPSQERRDVLGYAWFLLSALKKLPNFTAGPVYRVHTSQEFAEFLSRPHVRHVWMSGFAATTPVAELAQRLADPGGVVLELKTAHGKDVSTLLPLSKRPRVLLPFNLPFEVETPLAPDPATRGATSIAVFHDFTGAIYPNTFRIRQYGHGIRRRIF